MKPVFTRNPAGFSLFEVLVTLALLSFSLFIMLQTQRMALSKAQTAYLTQQLLTAQNSLVERLRSCADINTCESREIANWKQEMAEFFPYIDTTVTKQDKQYLCRVAHRHKKIALQLQFSL
jgi:prepilin-type N-terminal cleavage/methylation domain-containing protein